jgi:hypothetical protein
MQKEHSVPLLLLLRLEKIVKPTAVDWNRVVPQTGEQWADYVQ